MKIVIAFFVLLIVSPFSFADAPDDLEWNVTIEFGGLKTQPLIIGSEQDEFGDYIGLNIWLDLYYRGFFIQSNRYRSSGSVGSLEMGYELYIDKDYEINVIHKNYVAGFDSENAGPIVERDIPELSGIKVREYLPLQGIRYMRYLENSAFWIDIAKDVLFREHNGWVVDTFYAYTIESRNLDVTLGLGATYFSSHMNNYYFGVDSQEANPLRPEYRPGSGFRFDIEAVAHYPIAQDWLLTVGSALSHYSNSIADSPLVDRQDVASFKVSVSYVF